MALALSLLNQLLRPKAESLAADVATKPRARRTNRRPRPSVDKEEDELETQPSEIATRVDAPESGQRRRKAKACDLFVEPQEWSALAQKAFIELEIGSGKGLFLETAAKSRPDHQFIGVELSAKFSNRAADRLARAGLTNATMLRGDAESFLMGVVPEQSVLAVHVYFPDPWWRRKHKKRRVLNEETLAAIERSLVPEGAFHFWTDVLDYYELICTHIMTQTSLIGPRYVPERPASHDLDYTTHFERRARRHGQPIYRAIFVKPKATFDRST